MLHLPLLLSASYQTAPTVLLEASSWYSMKELICPLSSEHDVRCKCFKAIYLSQEFLKKEKHNYVLVLVMND